MKLWDKGLKTNEKVDWFTVGDDRTYDQVLVKYDVLASMAHARMLGKSGLLEAAEVSALVTALEKMLESIDKGDFSIEDQYEDMHSKIESLLTEELGDIGKKIHTARSRNDQVLVAMQLYMKDEIHALAKHSKTLFELLLDLAELHKAVLLPGYTHLQVAMPSSFGLWFSAYAESLIDDMALLKAAHYTADQNPLGSAAGYGSSFPIDRSATTSDLDFASLKYNVIAAQMGRGKVEKAAGFALAAIAGTLAKFAMDICLYMSQNFNFISFPESLTTGSSIMPHKKNPDVFELTRAKCNKLQAVPGQIMLLTTNLPSGYHRDLQLLKEIIMPAFQELKSCMEMTVLALKEIRVNKAITEDPKYDYIFSVERVNELVVEGLAFRDAYKQVAEEIANGNFVPNRELSHSHQGSIGNLCLDEIRVKWKNLGIPGS